MKKIFNDAADVQGYHIHIYLGDDRESANRARDLALAIKTLFPKEIEYFSLIGSVGPHPSPNYAIHITKEGFAKIIPWLQLNSQNLSILIHPETGDDLKDHAESAMWMGRPLELNNAFFGPSPGSRQQGPSTSPN